MNEVQAEIQALLQEMQSDGHGDDVEIEYLPNFQHPEQNNNSMRALEPYNRNSMGVLYSQQPLYPTQAAPILNTLSFSRESDLFDAYGWFSDLLLLFTTHKFLDRCKQSSHNTVQPLDQRRQFARPASRDFGLGGDIFHSSRSSHFQNGWSIGTILWLH